MTKLTVTIKIPAWLEGPFVKLLLIYRRLRFGYTFRRIPLTKGKFAIVDVDDYDRISKYKWYASINNHTCYAKRYVKKRFSGNNKTSTFMHRQILENPHFSSLTQNCRRRIPDGLVVDHINGNGLDNRKANLRLATTAENGRNKRFFTKTPASGFRGVWYNPKKKSFRASITFNHKKIHIGSFKDPRTAAHAYDKAAKKYHGAFAVVNFPKKCWRHPSY